MSLSIMLALGLAVGTANPPSSTQDTSKATAKKLDDRQISDLIVKKLSRIKKAGRLRDFDISMDVDKGRVWLKGSVASTEQRLMVRQAVLSIKHVKTLIDNMKISPTFSAAPASSSKRSLEQGGLVAQTTRPVIRSATRRTDLANLAPPTPTPAKKEGKGHKAHKKGHGKKGHDEHHEHHEVVYAENWDPDGCECCDIGKLPCPFKSTCDMPQHQAYSAQPAFYYYFRPYQWTHISLQQQEAAKYGLAPSNPYDNRFFEKIYKEVDDKIGGQSKESGAVTIRRSRPRFYMPTPAISSLGRRASASIKWASQPAKVQTPRPTPLKRLDLGKIDDKPIYRRSTKARNVSLTGHTARKLTTRKATK